MVSHNKLELADILRVIAAVAIVDTVSKDELRKIQDSLEEITKHSKGEEVNLELRDLAFYNPLPYSYNDCMHLARRLGEQSFEHIKTQFSAPSEEKAKVHEDVYKQLVPHGYYKSLQWGPIRNTILMLESLETFGVSIDGGSRDERTGNFVSYFVIPIANLFLKDGKFDEFTQVLSQYNQPQLLQRHVKSVYYESPKLFEGVDMIVQGNQLPGFLSEQGKANTSIIQQTSGFQTTDLWQISTEVDGKPFWGIRLYKQESSHANDSNTGYIETSSLNLALRLVKAANEGDKRAYTHALYLIKHSP